MELSTRTQIVVLVLYIGGAAISAIVCHVFSMKAAVLAAVLHGVLLMAGRKRFE